MVDQMVQTLPKKPGKVDFFCFLLRSDQIWFMLSQKDKKSYEKTWWWDDTVKNRIKVFF